MAPQLAGMRNIIINTLLEGKGRAYQQLGGMGPCCLQGAMNVVVHPLQNFTMIRWEASKPAQEMSVRGTFGAFFFSFMTTKRNVDQELRSPCISKLF